MTVTKESIPVKAEPEHHGKDHAGKYLEDYADVFADICNVLIFHKDIVNASDLLAGPTESMYKSENGNRLKEQRRDTTKYVQSMGSIISLIGLENQSTEDAHMPIRIMGYDYTSYRSQVDTKKELHPVITAVLYFGDKPWSKGSSLKQLFKDEASTYSAFVSDYKIRVIDVPRLPKKLRNQLTSDFREVAEFFANRKKKNYRPSTQKLVHVEAVLKLLEVFTGDARYRAIEDEVLTDLKEGVEFSVCEFAQRCEDRGMNRGIKEEINHGIQVLVSSLRKYDISDTDIIATIIEQYHISKTRAKKYVR